MEGATPRGAVTETTTFRLGTLGVLVTARFAEKIGGRGVRPKHVGLLAAIEAGVAGSQLELARALGVAPSVVVAHVDDLEGLGALRRVRDQDDRRRQNLVLTPDGRALLEGCAAAAREVDAEVTAELDEAQRVSLRELLGVMADTEGFTYKR